MRNHVLVAYGRGKKKVGYQLLKNEILPILDFAICISSAGICPLRLVCSQAQFCRCLVFPIQCSLMHSPPPTLLKDRVHSSHPRDGMELVAPYLRTSHKC